jgi:hypothetical protein
MTTPVITPAVSRTHTDAKGAYLNPGASSIGTEVDLRGGRRGGNQRGRGGRGKNKAFHSSTPFFSSWS